jgi:hypothetical protein
MRMLGWAWIVIAVVGLFVLDRLLLWMEARGWIYWRKVKRKGSGGADILDAISFTEPGAHHAVEARQERPGEEDEADGDADDKRDPGDRMS